MSAHEPLVTRAEVRAAARSIPPLDWLMLVLALASIGLLLWESFWQLTPQQTRFVVLADYTVCALFACEFVWRWRAAGWSGGYVRRNWYEVLGMIPLQQPALRAFRLFRLVRIVILLARFGMAADRAFGDEFTYRLVKRFKQSIVDSISGAVTLAVLGEVEQVLAKGTYTRNVSRALHQNRDELRAMVLEKLRQDPKAGRLSRLPFYNDIVEGVIDAFMRVGEQFLNDPRADELVADILRENLHQIRDALAVREATREAVEHAAHRHRPAL